MLRDDDALWDLVESGLFGDPALHILDEDVAEITNLEDGGAPRYLETPEVTEEDYMEEEERIAFTSLRDQVRLYCNVNTKPAARDKATEWVFVPGTQNQLGLDFALCCRALGTRQHLIQVRALYQLYIRQIIFSKPLPFLATPLPELLACEILYHFGDEELDAAKVVWLWPGIRADILLDRLIHKMPRPRAQAAMERLEERGYVALWSGFWWFTGRNPSMLSPSSRARFKWSDQIP